MQHNVRIASRTYTYEATAANVHTAVGGAAWARGDACIVAWLVPGYGPRDTATARSQSERKRERPCARARERYIGGFHTEHR